MGVGAWLTSGDSNPGHLLALFVAFTLVLGWGAYAAVRVRAAGADR